MSKEAHELFLKKAGIQYFTHTENFKTILLKTEPLKYVAACTNAKDGKELMKIREDYVHLLSEIPRDHPALWEVAEELGMQRVNDRFSKLQFEEIAADSNWKIKSYNEIEYIVIDPNPKPKFEGTCEHWYAADFRPGWMDAKKDTIILAGIDKKGNKRSIICDWSVLDNNVVDLVTYKWYPLSKLCPIFHAN